ncbi:MAG: VOC family protein [Clostridia bacterium]|nr:VOC family protein [Clostridia bacterium]
MNLDTIHHIAIICSDREKAIAFYVHALGFEIIRENYRAARDDWKIDLRVDGNTEIELFIMRGHPVRVTNPEAYGLRHIAFKVKSVADTVSELREKGIVCEQIRMDAYTGKAMTFFRDPDGLPIEIHE